MFNVLMESHETGSRRLGMTAASTVVHGVIIAVVVGSTGVVAAAAHERPEATDVTYVPVPARTEAPRPVTQRPPQRIDAPIIPDFGRLLVPPVTAPRELPSLKNPLSAMPEPSDLLRANGIGSSLPTGAGPARAGEGVGMGEAVDVAAVDRIPRLLGRAPVPVYPPALRQSGERGRVVMRFVIDTMGRAEMDGMQAREATNAAFVEAVRAALSRYRFSPGEAGGRKVRTLVEMPFEFTIAR